MSTEGTVAAWYPDPSDATSLRWWDGHQWTSDTRATVGGPSLRRASSQGRNHYSMITFGVGVLYLMLAFATHFVLIGFIPLALAMRAKRSGEPLAPLAMAAAVGVILVSLVTLIG